MVTNNMIQELMVVLCPPRGPLSLTVSWVNTSYQAFKNAGWTQRFTGTFSRDGIIEVPP